MLLLWFHQQSLVLEAHHGYAQIRSHQSQAQRLPFSYQHQIHYETKGQHIRHQPHELHQPSQPYFRHVDQNCIQGTSNLDLLLAYKEKPAQ